MTNKLKYLINMSLKRKVATKWFVIANLVLALVIVGLANIDSLVKAFGGDFNQQQMIYVVDNTNKTYDIFKNQVEELKNK
jgi:hypothetical protein